MIGRFLGSDPVEADPQFGSNFNRYWYANNNSYKFVDPDGRFVDTIADVVFIGADVAAIASEGLTVTNGIALTADVAFTFIPGATGGGALVRTIATAAPRFYEGSRLARAMSNVGRGVEKGVEQAHHIVAQGAHLADEARTILGKVGIDVHSALNGAALRTAEHAGMHTRAYYKQVNEILKTAYNSANTRAGRRAAVAKALATIRRALED